MRRKSLLAIALAIGISPQLTGLPFMLTQAQEGTPDSAGPVTTEAENEATARRQHEEAINQGNLAVIDEIVAEDVIHHAGTFPDGEGPDAIAFVLGALLTGFPDTRHTVEQVVVSGDFVIIRFQAEGTHEGEFLGYAPTGKRVTWSGINMFLFECGRIAEEWSEVDGLGRLNQLGVTATPTP